MRLLYVNEFPVLSIEDIPRVSKNARPESIFSARDLGLLAILVPQYLGQLIGFSA